MQKHCQWSGINSNIINKMALLYLLHIYSVICRFDIEKN